MIKKISFFLLIIVFLAIGISEGFYQGIVMNSAETIEPGNFKLAIAPTLLFGNNGGDDTWGFSGKAGLGLTERMDIEATGAFFDNFFYLGADLEYWAYKGIDLNISGVLGLHTTDYDFVADSSGIDTTLIISTRPSDRLELIGALKFSFDSFKNIDANTTLGHIVPGLEYRISNKLDALAELGIAITDDSSNYLSFGLAYYFMR